MKLKFAGTLLLLFVLSFMSFAASAQEGMLAVESSDVDVTSADQAYASYVAAPTEGGLYPGIVLIHSFNGLEEGYKTMVDQLAGEGFVVLAVGWQTFEQSPADDVVNQLVQDSIVFLSAREDVNPDLIGLTGFCAGGRYTMLLLPQIEGLKAGVAWYGFPMRGEPAPVALVGDLTAPMLIIHGTEDEPSPIADIYNYSAELMNVDADFEMKIYSGEPHGFMLSGGQLRTDDVAADAFREMADFFKRKLVTE
jgi:carboxymethylenebutenolidase